MPGLTTYIISTALAALALAVARKRAVRRLEARGMERSLVVVSQLAERADTLGERAREALGVVRRAMDELRLVVAFNGGKDCTVVLHLVAAECAARGVPLPEVVYFQRGQDFDELHAFVRETEAELGFTTRVLTGGYKAGLDALRAEGVEACVMGQRRTDPYCPPLHFAPTTEGWPRMMRVNPILDMNYEAVWGFLIQGRFHYCVLYDRGYTSLGAPSQTVPNAQLILNKMPAHELRDGDVWEREGRTPPPVAGGACAPAPQALAAAAEEEEEAQAAASAPAASAGNGV